MADSNLIEQLLVGLGFEFEGEDGERFKKQTEVVASTINKVAVAAGVATAALFAMSKSTATSNDELAKTARSLDSSAKSLSGWQHTANLAGVGGDRVVEMLKSLRETAQEAERTGSGPFRAYAELGVDFQALSSGALDVTDALDLIIANAQKMDRTLAQGALKELGIDNRFLDMPIDQIRLAREEGEKWGGVTEDVTTKSEAFNDAMARTLLRFDGIQNMLSGRVLPALTAFFDTLSKGLEWIQTQGFPILDEVVASLGGWETVLIGLTAAAGIPLLIKSLTTVLSLVKLIGKGMGGIKLPQGSNGTPESGKGGKGKKGGGVGGKMLGATVLYPVVDEILQATIGDTDFAQWAQNTTLDDVAASIGNMFGKSDQPQAISRPTNNSSITNSAPVTNNVSNRTYNVSGADIGMVRQIIQEEEGQLIQEMDAAGEDAFVR